jgi:hypothetical protein
VRLVRVRRETKRCCNGSRRRQEPHRLAQADAEALRSRDHAAETYSEARQRERDVILPDRTTHAFRTLAHTGGASRIGTAIGSVSVCILRGSTPLAATPISC